MILQIIIIPMVGKIRGHQRNLRLKISNVWNSVRSAAASKRPALPVFSNGWKIMTGFFQPLETNPANRVIPSKTRRFTNEMPCLFRTRMADTFGRVQQRRDTKQSRRMRPKGFNPPRAPLAWRGSCLRLFLHSPPPEG